MHVKRVPPDHGRISRGRSRRWSPTTAIVVIALLASGCESPFDAIDARTDAILRETSASIGTDALPPSGDRTGYAAGRSLTYPKSEIYRPPTNNPAAEAIPFRERVERSDAGVEAKSVIGRLETSGSVVQEGVLRLDLTEALAIAMRQARELKSAEEEYILAALRLLIERHAWGPRFFNDVSATVTGVAEDNAYNSALRVVNDLRVTQRLPYGGDVSARLLARATEDLREKVAGEGVQTAELILSANIPLLRGAGLSAAESRIQAERNLVYAARTFEEFRRQFLVNIARDFLGLVVQSRGIENSERQLIRLRDFQAREEALVQAGRQPPFQAALSAQDVLFAEDNLRSQKEAFRLAVDRFKVRLNIPVDQEVEIVPSTLGLPVPEADMDEAVRNAMAYRLDLQNRRDQLDDTYRAIDIAKNQLLPDLDFSGSVGVPSDPGKDRDGLQLDFERNDFSAGITFGLPLDRETERLRLRQSQIAAERAQREYQRFRDTLVIDVRDAVREIDRAAFSLRLQEENIAIARRRLESIEVAPDRATARDKSDAADGLTRAENDRDRADRDLQVSILEYLLQTGTLRVNSDGTIRPLQGMTITPRSDDDRDDRDDNNREAGEAGGG